jgi:hypothetical protein
MKRFIGMKGIPLQGFFFNILKEVKRNGISRN